jgi:hypothetical protein
MAGHGSGRSIQWARAIPNVPVRASVTLAAGEVVVGRAGNRSWPRLCALYAALVAVSFGYVAQPGGPEWLAGGELLWIVVDLCLLRAMLRGSVNALIVCGALDSSTLFAVIFAEFGQPQPGFSVMVSLLVARVIVLLQAWRQGV